MNNLNGMQHLQLPRYRKIASKFKNLLLATITLTERNYKLYTIHIYEKIYIYNNQRYAREVDDEKSKENTLLAII